MSHKKGQEVQLNRRRPVDADRYTDLRLALRDEGPPFPETPYGATKTAELDVQFSIDPSYGLSKSRYGWYSNGTLFDDTHFSEETGKIRITTSATAGDSARLRSAFPGQYVAHTIAEPGIGASIPEEHLEFDGDDQVSLTHGEISLEISQFSDSLTSGITAHGISFEPDGAYHQVRSEDNNVEFTHQSDWNIDPMDGTGPSGRVLRPQDGYVYQFIYSWYGEGSCILAVEDSRGGDDLIPLHRYPALAGSKSLDAPNMPLHVFVENKDTADPLSVKVGGMQYATHGGRVQPSVSRTTEESRMTSGSYIDTPATTTNGAIDPFSEAGRPLVAVRRDVNSLRSRKGLKFTVEDFFIDADQDIFLFIFDEYNEESALTGATFGTPESRGNGGGETRIQTDTQATDYTPSNDAILRGMAYVSTTNKAVQEITGDTTSNVPLDATAVVTAVLHPDANATDARPFLLETTEQF